MIFKKSDELFARAGADPEALQRLIQQFKAIRSVTLTTSLILIASLIGILIYTYLQLEPFMQGEISQEDFEDHTQWAISVSGLLFAFGFLLLGCALNADNKVKTLLLKQGGK